MENLCTTLSCVWQANGAISQFEVRNFMIDSDQMVKAVGTDQCGTYHFVGKAEKDGKITMTRTYSNMPHVMPLCFQGTIHENSTIQGQVINGGNLAGTFCFTPCFRLWEGYVEDSNKKCTPVFYNLNFIGDAVYGFGKDRAGLYLLKGALNRNTQKMTLSEFRIGETGLVYDGDFRVDGNQCSLRGNWKSGATGSSGTFEISQRDPNQKDIPPMTLIETNHLESSEHSPKKPAMSKEQAKPGLKTNPTPLSTSNIPPPVPQLPQVAQYQQPITPQYGFNPAGGHYYPPGNYQQPMLQGVSQAFYQATNFVDFNLLVYCVDLPTVNMIAGQIALGLKVRSEDLLMFYKLCKNDHVRMAMTNTVSRSIENMNPANYYLAVKENPSSEVQLSILQGFGHYVRGQLTPDMKEHLVKLIVFNQEQSTARSILSQI